MVQNKRVNQQATSQTREKKERKRERKNRILLEKQEKCFCVHHIAIDRCTNADIQEKTEEEKKELDHQYHRNTVIVKKGTTSSLFL